jgi:tRNA threonylcarbamoyladenosine biosynthesis protein TsaE
MEWEFSLDTINQVAKDFWKRTGGKTVFAFHGQVGAGKTTFIHALCDEMGVKDVVGSPTFSIINEYEYITAVTGKKRLFHIDLYRLEDKEEAVRAGVEDCLYSGSVCLVEWPDKVPALFNEHTVHVYIEPVDMKTRRLKISNN